jgi:hypothetical protein
MANQNNDQENSKIAATPMPMAVPMARIEPAQKPLVTQPTTKNDAPGSKP